MNDGSPLAAPDNPAPTDNRLTDRHRLETALTELKNAAVDFHVSRAEKACADIAWDKAQERLHKARIEVDVLTRLDDSSAVPGAFMGKPKG